MKGLHPFQANLSPSPYQGEGDKGDRVTRIKMGVIDEVKQKIDIVEVVSGYVPLTKAGRTFKALCPFHSEKHPSFFVYPEQQNWHCFGACNTGGDIFSFVMKKEGIDFGEALGLLAQKAGVTIKSRFEPEAEGKEKERLYQANQAAAKYFHNLLLNSPAGEKVQSYLTGRGFSLKTTTSFQLGFSLNEWEALKKYLLDKGYTEGELLAAGLVIETEAGEAHDRFRNRLMFPILDGRGRTIGFGARVLDDSLPKYLNSPQTPIFDKSGSLYGINVARAAIRQQDMVVIVEGYMDVLQAHQNGFNNVIASMGTSVTEKQVTRLKRLTKNVALALDADAAGEEAMLRCVGYENTLNAEIKVIVLPEGKDPDDIIKKDAQAWQHLVEGALPVVDYTFNVVTAKLDLTTAKDKSSAVDKLLPIIAEMKDTVRQAHYLQALARLVEISQRDLEAALGRIKASRGRRRLKEPKPETVGKTVRPLFSRPVEEDCLALLLQHPELKSRSKGLAPEYFENSENREIFIACQQADDLSLLKERLDPTLHEYFDTLVAKSIPATTGWEEILNDYIHRLQKEFLQSLATKRAQALSLVTESDSSDSELAKLQEPAKEISTQLKEVFTQKSKRR